MRKITFSLLLLLSFNLQAAIVVKDITDYTFTQNGLLNFDFNSDGTPEFAFTETAGSIGAFFDNNNVNFVGTGSFASGHGWDIMKSLTAGTLISSTSSFEALGDAYINAMHAYSNEMFPNGDSYIGTKFKLADQWYYGWILVNANGSAITIKSYAYNNVANQGLNAGETLNSDSFIKENIKFYPNPAKDFIKFTDDSEIENVTIYDELGKAYNTTFINNLLDIQHLKKGVYFLHITHKSKNTTTSKIVK